LQRRIGTSAGHRPSRRPATGIFQPAADQRIREPVRAAGNLAARSHDGRLPLPLVVAEIDTFLAKTAERLLEAVPADLDGKIAKLAPCQLKHLAIGMLRPAVDAALDDLQEIVLPALEPLANRLLGIGAHALPLHADDACCGLPVVAQLTEHR